MKGGKRGRDKLGRVGVHKWYSNYVYIYIYIYIYDKTPKENEKIKKELCKIFCENDLKIMIEASKTIINFLDVTLDLQSAKHYP